MLSSPLILAVALTAGLSRACTAQDFDLAPVGTTPPPSTSVRGPTTLFQGVRISDGKSATLSPPSNVLVRNNIIERISASSITVDANAIVVVGNERALMPGLIDAHWHAFMVTPPQITLHAYTPHALRQAVAAGVKCIDHGQLIDEPTGKLLADKGM